MGTDTKKKLVRDHHKSSDKSPKKVKSKKSSKTDKSEKTDKLEKPRRSKKPESDPKPEQVEEPPAKHSKKSRKPQKDSAPHEEEDGIQEIQKRPGQKHPEPSLDDPTRAFYETLYEQNPSSPMAQKYCLEYGLLPEDVASTLSSKLKSKK